MGIKKFQIAGIAAFLLMITAYFIKIPAESGENYVIQDSLLGIAIFHNPFVLGIYILIGIFLVALGNQKCRAFFA